VTRNAASAASSASASTRLQHAETPRWQAGASSLSIRVLSALLLAPVFVAAVYAGGWVFLAVVVTLMLLGADEYCRMAFPGRRRTLIFIAGWGSAAVLLRFLLPGGGAAVEALLLGALLMALSLGLAAPAPREGVRVASLTFLGALYVGWLFSYFVALRELPSVMPGLEPHELRPIGFAFVMVPVLITWTNDVAAYFAGRALGGRKLLARVSPGKTVAGAIGGLMTGGLVGAVIFTYAPLGLPALSAVGGFLVGAAAACLAQVGDLAESLLKRAFDVKDSSRLIPGHGGVLDRFDALLFTLPAAYYFFRLTI
jgi:phosphatidate cytidylyltransferase